jgi:hypothetical protein
LIFFLLHAMKERVISWATTLLAPTSSFIFVFFSYFYKEAILWPPPPFP